MTADELIDEIREKLGDTPVIFKKSPYSDIVICDDAIIDVLKLIDDYKEERDGTNSKG